MAKGAFKQKRQDIGKGLITKGLDMGLSLSDMAKLTGFHINTLSKWQKGLLNIRPQNIYKLKKALNENEKEIDLSKIHLMALLNELANRGFDVSLSHSERGRKIFNEKRKQKKGAENEKN